MKPLSLVHLSLPVCAAGRMLLPYNELEGLNSWETCGRVPSGVDPAWEDGCSAAAAPRLGRAADRVCLSPVPGLPGRAVSLLGFILGPRPCSSITSRGPLPWALPPLLSICPLGPRVLVVPACRNRLCFLKMILTN